MTRQPPSYHGYRFPPEIISHAVWLYHRFCLSFRDAEDLLAQRGITVTYETIRQWCQTFGLDYARRLRRPRAHGRHLVSGRDIRDHPGAAAVPLAGRGHCQVDGERIDFPPVRRPLSPPIQVHVTSRHASKARLRNKR